MPTVSQKSQVTIIYLGVSVEVGNDLPSHRLGLSNHTPCVIAFACHTAAAEKRDLVSIGIEGIKSGPRCLINDVVMILKDAM